jgi:excinuclease ABC subunit A
LNAYYFNGVKNQNHKKIEGLDLIDKVIILTKADRRTPRSNPATYTEVFTEIRKLFTMTSESMIGAIRRDVSVLT